MAWGADWHGWTLSLWAIRSCRRLRQSVAGQDVVGEGEPMQQPIHFLASSNGELIEAPLPQAGVDAFAHAATLEDAFAVWALHAPAPGSHARTIIGTWRIGIGLVLATHRRAIHLHSCRGGPFGIVILVEAAIDQMRLWAPVISALKLIEHRPQQAAVRAGGLGFYRDHDLALGHGADLAVVGRTEAAVRHLHHARLRVGSGAPRLLLGLVLLVATSLGPLFTLLLELSQRPLRRRHPLGAFTRRPLLRRFDPPIAGVRIVVGLLLQPLDQPLGLLQFLVQLLLAAERA